MKRIASWLRRLADWLDASPVLLLRVPKDDVLLAAATEVARVELTEVTATGQNKRHQVEGRLYHRFPDVSRRAVSRAIEAVLPVETL